MTSITVSLPSEDFARLERVAEAHNAQPAQLLQAYAEYLAAGGPPLPVDDGPTSADIARLISTDRAWAWLYDEPDIYTAEDGEPYRT